MKYTIQEIAKIIRATHRTLNDGVIERLLIDSRMLSFPETTLFFALKTRTNDGHRYLFELYRLGVRSFVVNHEPAEARMMPTSLWFPMCSRRCNRWLPTIAKGFKYR